MMPVWRMRDGAMGCQAWWRDIGQEYRDQLGNGEFGGRSQAMPRQL
jgi:hypothetical protein